MKSHNILGLKLFRGGAEALSPTECVQLMGDLLVALAHHGYIIHDYDDKARQLFGFMKHKGGYTYLSGYEGDMP